MTKAIFSVGALFAAAIALAGCGGGSSASGTTGGVAGAHQTRGSGSFRASVHGFEARVQTSVQAFRSGNLAGAVSSGGSLLTSCARTVDGKIAPQASTSPQKQAVGHLRSACAYMSKAAKAGASGHTAEAKQLAQAALQQSQVAARLGG
jgi:hypothetical protein